MKRNIPEFQYVDAWKILSSNNINGNVVDDKSLEIMLRIEESMSSLEVMGDDDRRFFWIRSKDSSGRYEWLWVLTAHYKDFHYLILSDGKFKFTTLKNKDGVVGDSRKDRRYDYSDVLLSLEAHVNAVVEWICEDSDGYNKYVNRYIPYHKRNGDIPMKTLMAIDPRYECRDETHNIKTMELIKSSIPTLYDKKTLRNYISVWSAAFRILEKSKTRYGADELENKTIQDCAALDDIELFRTYDSKGEEIEGLDLDSESDFDKWYNENLVYHCMDVGYARIHLGFSSKCEGKEEDSSQYQFTIWFSVSGYWEDVMEIAIGLYNQGIILKVRNADDILEFLKKDYLVGFRPCPDKYMNRDGVKAQVFLPYIGDVTKEVYWKIIKATSWHKEPMIRPMSIKK
ncbi:MAG: hypothetical protein HUJ91_05850 [Bacteroidales bacterium]|nr:hypothetical protein [Bacteroidales bacterium]